MRTGRPAVNLVLRMTAYVFLFFALLYSFSVATIFPYMDEVNIGAVFVHVAAGAALTSAMLGLTSGIVMAWVAVRRYRIVENPLRFKLTMALIPVTINVIIGLFTVSLKTDLALSSVLERAIIFGLLLLASQLAARSYIRETTARKPKEKS